MTACRIAPTGDHLTRSSVPFVVCADTVWSAFADAQHAEWDTYLRRRAGQGFTALLISVLPILDDRSLSSQSRRAFARTPPGRDRELDPTYLAAAVALVEAAVEAGLTPALVVTWYEYVSGERGTRRTPSAILNPAEQNNYLDTVAAAFTPYDPLYVVSGDESFTSDDPGPYLDLLRRVKERAPGVLTTLHTTPETTLPSDLASCPDLDFYSYQSGHYADRQDLPFDLAQRYLAASVRRPVMNLEPCYEGHGWGHSPGRFTADAVRRALWSSIFGGANAGLGYGAHGLWQWHRPGAAFNNARFSGEPFPWDTAMQFPGAWSAALAAAIIRDFGLYRTRPTPELIRTPMEARALATDDRTIVAVYTPYATGFDVEIDTTAHAMTAFDLARGRRFRPRTSFHGGVTRVALPDFPGDALYLFGNG